MKKIKYLLLLLLLSPLGLLAQQISISGKVIDLTDGSTLPGVSVKIKGTTAGAVTDISGKFLIVVPNSDAVLQLSYIGYVTQEIAVKNIKDGVIALTATNKSLDEVVVVGYGVQKRATVTGSIATLQSKEIITTKNESVVNMLTGKIPGIRVVQTTAEPGSFANKLNIRGYQGLPPLVVIDGVIAGNDQAIIAKMDPNEIENMSVLKDAAASIYGMRAAGGAILVTTKKGGKNGKINVNYSVNNSIQTFLGMPEGVNAVDYMMLTNEKVKRDFANNFVANVTPQYSYADIQPYLNGTRKSADWSSLVFRKTANQIEHNLNIDGGNDKISYFFNFGYQKQDGVFKTGDLNYNKYNFRSNVTATITKGLKAQVLTSAYMDQKNQPYTDEWTVYKYTWNQIPIHQIYANDNPLYPAVMDDNMNPSIITDDSKVGFKTSKNKSITSQLNFTYDIPGIQGLTAKALFNVDYGVNDFNQIKRAYSLYTYSAADNTYIPSLVNSPSGITRAYYTHFNTLSQLTLSYLHTFGQDHNVNATIGYEQSHETADNFNAYRDIEIPVNYLFGGLQNSNMSGGMDAGALSDRAHRSIIGRANYDYKGKYLAEFSFRRDGNNLYKPGADQWGFFPGGSVGWVITKEKFFSNLVSDRILSNLKIRASYGQVGDESNAQAFNYVNGYTYPVNTYIFGASAVNGSAPKLGNPGLTWSVSTIKNIALDFGLFGGKVDGTVEVFRNDRTGLPATPAVALPGTVGADVPQINYNSDRVQGLDFSLSYRNTFGALGVNVTGNIGTTRLERIKVLEGGAGNEYLAWKNSQTNRYQNIWWGPEYAGQFTNYKQIYNYGINTGGGNNNVVPGDYYYKDWNNDGVIDDKDSHPIATNDIPLYNYGLNIGLSYKGFDMTLLLAGAAGVYVQYGEQFASPLMYGRSALTRFLDSWHTADPNANVFDPNTQWVPGFYPAMGSPDAQGTKAIQNASYLRIKTLEFGYSLSPATLKTIGIKKLRVYVNSYNLLTFTGLKNYDPEHQGPNPTDGGNFGVALGGYTYPMNRTFNVGANVSF
ncbi:SusC/RagA family TonB-linked outer membrane protein [Mucilaginibacter flavus]|uniref:SusC/RagA family TonB-linked outer membrane protein n=1 Tax=Mucilaginibacter flavus TaxID=931504 RepID=UPI0025B5224B|nr:TonB-dependent receptor [Mucilaginibacter flavus]MDN3583050.1 TonB-dependent receptor [Mucilaginibacter flavus]